MDDPSGRAAIGRAEVLRIARLARLRLGDEEVELFTRQLNDILAHAQEIADAEPDASADAEPYAFADEEPARGGAASLRLRDPSAQPDPLVAGPEAFAPAFPDGLFAVPRLEAMDEDRSP
ncbi:MAG TPA: aspartyl/glutamyl-tRNA amidotransferase subunit C [Longimicrobiales bacterium]|nr:aspartyl/glutamyl-tRNA amidotransferase subunit C [Longimicrobiales bacterium]